MGRTATVVEVASQSSPGKTYRVWVDAEGPVFCDCPAHKFARGGVRRPCKHMAALRASTDTYEAAKTIAAGRTAPEPRTADQRFRFLEVQEETDDGAWVSVADLRFSRLEVD